MAAASTEPKVAASEAHGDAETEAYFWAVPVPLEIEILGTSQF